MAAYDLNTDTRRYDKDYLIVDFDHLFIAATLREEIWLLQSRNDHELIDEIIRAASAFTMLEVAPDRNLDLYSTGQQAILACLLVMAVIRANNRHNLKLLLNHVLESISPANRRRLLLEFDRLRASHGIRLFIGQQGDIKDMDRANG